MYRIIKVLNHNTVLAVKDKSAREYLIVGKGVGFGKKITQSVEPTEEDSLVSPAVNQSRDMLLSLAVLCTFCQNLNQHLSEP